MQIINAWYHDASEKVCGLSKYSQKTCDSFECHNQSSSPEKFRLWCVEESSSVRSGMPKSSSSGHSSSSLDSQEHGIFSVLRGTRYVLKLKTPSDMFAAMRSMSCTRCAGGPSTNSQVLRIKAAVNCFVGPRAGGRNMFCGCGIGEKARFCEAPVSRFMRSAAGGVGTSRDGGRTLSSSESLTSGGVDGGEERRVSTVGDETGLFVVGVTGAPSSAGSEDGALSVISDVWRRCLLRPRVSWSCTLCSSAHGLMSSASASSKQGEGLRCVSSE